MQLDAWRAWCVAGAIVILGGSAAIAQGAGAARTLLIVDEEDGETTQPPPEPDRPRGRKVALCVGIDRYRRMGKLHSCVNDARAWGEMLETKEEYAVDTLLDDDATKAAILGRLRKMVDAAAAGDRIVFVFSGHGGQERDRSGDEADRKDETLCAYDEDVIDDEIDAVFQKKKDGVKIVMIADSCHSGTVNRAPGLAGSGGALAQAKDAAAPAVRKRYEYASLLLGGCQDRQTSAGTHKLSALTEHALKCWKKGPETAQEWYDSIVESMKDEEEQVPSLVGSMTDKDRRPF